MSCLSQLVVELTDVRIIAFGVLNKPRGSTTANTNARILLHPPGVEKNAAEGVAERANTAEPESKSSTRPPLGQLRIIDVLGAFYTYMSRTRERLPDIPLHVSPVASGITCQLSFLHARRRGQTLAREWHDRGGRVAVGGGTDVSSFGLILIVLRLHVVRMQAYGPDNRPAHQGALHG